MPIEIIKASGKIDTNGHRKGTTVLLALDELKIDPATQRGLVEPHVTRLAANLDPELIGVLYVSKRDDGYYIVDGQHRAEALRRAGYDGDTLVECVVFATVDKADEAKRFNGLNATRQVNAIDAFKVRCTANETIATDISHILKRHGLKIGFDSRDGIVACVTALEGVYTGRIARTAEMTPWALEQSIAALSGAWGTQRTAFDAPIVNGMGAFQIRYGNEIDQDNLAKRLAKTDGGPVRLLARSKIAREVHGGQLYKCVGGVILDIYNLGRRSSQLPAWRR